MASKTINFSSLLLLLLLLTLSALSQLHATQEPKIDIRKISTCLSDKGYNSMALTLQMTLPSLIPPHSVSNTTAFTIFSPTDKAFLSSKYPQPPLTLLRYHVTPSTFNKTLPHGSKIDTLLRGHPLVATGSHHKALINGVKIVEWDVYNDGKVIVHGVEEFFDPAFQTLRYPWFDDNNGGCDGGGNNESKVVKGFRDYDFRFIFLGVLRLFVSIIFFVVNYRG